MRKLALLIFGITLIITGCQQEDKGYYLTGTIEGVENGKKVFISERDETTNSFKTLDTTTITDGKFEIDMPEENLPSLSFLRIEGVNGTVVYIAEDEKINFEINRDSIANTKISGGKENTVLAKYLDHMRELNGKMQGMQQEMRQAMMSRDTAKINSFRATQAELRDNDKNFKDELISSNQDSYVSVLILTDLLNSRMASSEEVREKYEGLSDRVKETGMGKSLKESLDNAKASEIGSKAPGFTAPNPEGEELSLEDNLGKVTVVDFWAAWCKPCRIENPNLVRTYNKYKDQGLNIISVSLDRPGQKDRWIKAIEEDNLEQWDHVSNLKFWNDPIAKKYKVTAIPATFVLDENGVIVAKNLRGDALANKIGELID